MAFLSGSDVQIKITTSSDAKGADETDARLKSLGSSIGSLFGNNGSATASVSGLTGAIFNANLALKAVEVGADLVGSAIHAAFDLGGSILGQASAYQQVSIAFKTMLGDAGKAKTLLQQVSDFAAQTPFDLPQVAEGAKQLLAYNISADRVLPTFKMLGDTAAGVGMDKLPYLINAFGQVQAKGHLAGQELLQFTNSGVGLQKQLQSQLGLTSAQFDKMMAAGQISSDQVVQAFQRMTGPGGLFFNLMEEQSTTFDGTLSNLHDNFIRTGMDIIGISQDGTIRKGSLFQSLTDAAQQLLDWTNKNRGAIEEFGKTVLDRVVTIIKKDVVPWVEAWGKKLMDYIGSPQFKTDMKNLWQMLRDTGDFLHTAFDWTSRWLNFMDGVYNKVRSVWDILNQIAHITPAGMLADLFRTGTIPGLSSILSLAHTLHIPGFAAGVTNFGGGLAYVHQGEVLANLPAGTDVIPKARVPQFLDRAGKQITINQYNTINQPMDLGLAAARLGHDLSLRI